MFGRTLRIGRIAGIPVGISPWWLAIVALITWSLGDAYYPETVAHISPGAAYLLGFASALLLFASILAHEFGHAIVARRHGIEIEEIDLWLLGGVSRMRGEAHDPDTELRYALAGPAVTALIAVAFAALTLALPASTPQAVRAVVEYQLIVNVLILGFNLIPAFPLDGGRVLRSLLWRRSADMRQATATAASVGRTFGYVLIALGMLELFSGTPQGLWLALVGFFIVAAAGSQALGAEVQAVLSGVHARDLMSTPVVSIPAHSAATQAGPDYFAPYRYTAFPVIDADGRAIGLLNVEKLEALRRSSQLAAQRVQEIADTDPGLLVEEDEDVARLLERPAFARVGRAAVVDRLGAPVGLLSITDVQRALRAARLAGPAAAGRHATAG
ncbi:MAG TPA: site-2 protease family protein [Solirubrobacteraceae bacterium]|jgi:Zn-dependent protease